MIAHELKLGGVQGNTEIMKPQKPPCSNTNKPPFFKKKIKKNLFLNNQ